MNHLCLISVLFMKPLYIEHCIYTKTIIHTVFRCHYITKLYRNLWQTMCTEIYHLAMQIKSESIPFFKKKKIIVVVLSLFLPSLFRIIGNYCSHCHRYKASNYFTRVSKQYCRMESRSMERFSTLFFGKSNLGTAT